MLATIGNQFHWRYSLNTAPSTTPGVTVTPGAGAEGSWVALASGANLTQDVYGVLLWFHAGNTSTGIRDIIADLGIDPAGGSSYVTRIADIMCSQASNAAGSGFFYYFPLFIKNGQSVGMRGYSNAATTFRCKAIFYGKPTRPDLIRAGQYSESLGVSAPGGTPMTGMGVSAAEGSWVSLGATTRALWWWQLCVGFSNGTTTALMYYVDLAYGDGTNMVTIMADVPVFIPGTSEQTGLPLWPEGYCEVPAGATVYARVSCSGTPGVVPEVLAIGIGG